MRRWIFVTVLTVTYCHDYIERNVLYLLALPIKQDLDLSDAEIGLLTTAFAIFHAGMAWPISLHVERTRNRLNVLSASVLLWSAGSAASATVANFWQLLSCRVLVGIGEATITPVAQTLLSDLFAPDELTAPLSIYLAGIPIGSFVAFLAGGYITAASSWRLAFLLISAPGPLLAALVWLSLKDPRSQKPSSYPPKPPPQQQQQQLQQRSLDEDEGLGPLSYFFRKMRLLLCIPGFIEVQLANGAAAGALTSFYAWSPALLSRRHGLDSIELGGFLAVSQGLLLGVGLICWGGCIDALVQRTGDVRWLLRVPIGVGSISLASICVACAVRDVQLCRALIMGGCVGAGLWYGPLTSLVQLISPLGARALAASTTTLTASIGGAIGAPLIGWLSDRWQFNSAETPGDALSAAMVLVISASSLMACASYARAACVIHGTSRNGKPAIAREGDVGYTRLGF
jgi:MFS family permease